MTGESSKGDIVYAWLEVTSLARRKDHGTE